MNESLDLHSLYLASSLDWVLLGHGSFLLQSNSYLLCGSANTSTMQSHCPCCVALWLMLARPPLGLSYTFLLLSSCSPVLLLDLFSYYFGASLAYFILLGILGPLHSFGHPQPIPILHSHRLLINSLGFRSEEHTSELQSP